MTFFKRLLGGESDLGSSLAMIPHSSTSKPLLLCDGGEKQAALLLEDHPRLEWMSFARANGDFYEGETLSGKPHGKGKTFFKDGSVHEGEYHNLFRCGRGREYRGDAAIYEGDYKNDLRHGTGILYKTMHDHRGTACDYSGEFANGLPHGKGELKGVGAVVHCKQGLLDGAYKAPGVVGRYVNGMKDGPWSFEHTNGSVSSGRFSANVKVGEWKTKSSDKSIETVIEHGLDGTRLSIKQTKNGCVTFRGTIKDDKVWEGAGTQYDPKSGRPLNNATWVDGKFHGKFVALYDSRGNLESVCSYENGVRHGYAARFSNGIPIPVWIGEYDNGVQVDEEQASKKRLRDDDVLEFTAHKRFDQDEQEEDE